MKLGIGTYTFGWAVGVNGFQPAVPLNEGDLLDIVAREKIRVVQIGDNLPLHQFDSERLASLAVRARENGIKLEIGARRLEPARLSEYFRIARALDASLIRFVIDDAGFEPSWESVVSILREMAPELNGLTLGIENHDRFPAQVLRHIIEQTDSERIGICLDTANSLGAGEGIEHILDQLARHTVNLHIKDFFVERFPHKMGFMVTGRPAGSGMLEIEDLLDAVQRFGRCESAILELWTPPEPTIEETIAKESRWALESLAYLKPLFQNRYE